MLIGQLQIQLIYLAREEEAIDNPRGPMPPSFFEAQEKAVLLSNETLRKANRVGIKLCRAAVHFLRGQILMYCGRAEQALSTLQEAGRLFRLLGDRCAEANCLYAGMDCHMTMRNKDKALADGNEALNIAREIGDYKLEDLCRKR